jgi:hypothetical protein
MSKSFDKDRLTAKMEQLQRSIETKVRSIQERVEERMRRISERVAERLGRRGVDIGGEIKPKAEDYEKDWAKYIHAKVDLYQGLKLAEIDGWYDDLFGISRHFTGENLAYPTCLCETLEEFFEPHVRHLAISKSGKIELVERMAREAEEMARHGGGGIYGVNWPGDGCYINGWLFAYPNTGAVKEVLNDPQKLPSVVGVVAHEKLGHGFLSEFTCLGKERENVQLSRYKIAEDFAIRLSDSPSEILLREKWEILFLSSMFAEEGYATWVEAKMLEALTGNPQRPYHPGAVMKLLDLMVRSCDDKELLAFLKAVNDSVRLMLEPEGAGSKELHAAAIVLEQAEPVLERPFSRTFGQPARYVLGYLLVERLEEHFGTRMVPYAMSVIYNVDYDLEMIANTDLARVVQKEPRMNIHSRALHMLTLPKSAGGSIAELFKSANELLSFAVPANVKP